MTNLTTNYMGIELKNPIIVGASELVSTPNNLNLLEEAGAAAVVYKSLYEEQLMLEEGQMNEDMEEYEDRNAEMITLFPHLKHAGPAEHLLHLREARKRLTIPLFASINAINTETWVDFAQQIEKIGVDGLELNFYSVPYSFSQASFDIEKKQIETLKAVKAAVKIPVAVKLSANYANPLHFIKQLDEAGANAVILFNRFYQPEIDINSQEHVAKFNLSANDENRQAIRFAGLLYDNIQATIVGNSGIHTGEDVIKLLLAGADATQIVSTIYRNKIPYLSQMLIDISTWMKDHNYNTISDFKGNLSNKKLKDPFVYRRGQYIDLLLRSSETLNRNSLV